MIVAHLSDLHLGYRGFGRWDHGVNVRERDVSRAFQAAVEGVITARPDLVVITGDVFDRPDPSPAALVTLTRGIEALRRELPETPVHLVAGARDTPRRAGDSGALAALDAFPNVEAATSIPRTIFYEDRSLNVHLVPHRAVLAGAVSIAEPDPRARFNVLAAYGRVQVVGARSPEETADSNSRGSDAANSDPTAPAPAAEPGLDPTGWNYIALGSEHGHRDVWGPVVYAGALERVGATPWREAGQDKGFVVADLVASTHRFERVAGRAVVALAPTRAPHSSGAALRDRFAEVVREVPGGIDGKIVRVRLRGPRPGDLAELAGVLPELTRTALHLSVEVEDPGGMAPSEPLPDLAERAVACLPEGAPEATAGLLRQLLPARPGATTP